MNILIGTSAELNAGLESELATYRHRVFVEQLGWELPQAEPGLERDQFDGPETLYVVAKDNGGNICGCARLLSTEQAYLLSSVFPHLMGGGQTLPSSPEIWELSRYTTQVVDGEPTSREESKERFGALLKAVVQAALERGAKRLITFSYAGVERLARSFGIHVHRAGATHIVDGKPVLAFWVELDEQTFNALGIVRTVQSTFTH
jgi:acyl homoserine lactone synthase